ncbi:MAG: YraN family protein [Cyanobacteria bacterium P01_C01_bin.72]
MKKIGDLGEKLVGRWLELHNYQILARNWRCRWGEIDLIAQEQTSKAIAFVEVKTRSFRNWDADGMLAVNYTKQQKLIQTASFFLAQHPLFAELPCTFDIALVSYQLLNLTTATLNRSTIADFGQISDLEIGDPVVIENYQLKVKDYLPASFD